MSGRRNRRNASFPSGLSLPIDTISTGIAKAVRGVGKILAADTCNSDEEIGKALHMMVDVMITDALSKALKLRADFCH